MTKRKGRLKNGTNAKAKPRGEVTLAEPRGDMGALGPANRARVSKERMYAVMANMEDERLVKSTRVVVKGNSQSQWQPA